MTQYSLDVNLNLPQTPKSDNIPPEEWSEFLRIYNAIRTLAAYSNQLAQAIAGGGGGGSSSSSTTFGAMQQFLDAIDQEAPLLIPGPVGAASTVPGPAGPAGQSIRGLDGEDGEPAIPIPGIKGDQGPQGNTGPAGVSIRGLDGEDGENGLPIPGQQGIQGNPGSTGPQGAPGANIIIYDGDDGEQSYSIKGEKGDQGIQGIQGPQGFQGSNIVIYDGDDGIDGLPIPGNKGDQGIQGIPGVAGTPGANIIILEGDAGDDGLTIPGKDGTIGQQGIQGPVGPAGANIIIYDGDDGEVAIPIPGNKGADGAQGPIGLTGPAGLSIFRDWGEDGIDGIPIPGNPGVNGLAGAQWLSGSGDPNVLAISANNGDFWLNTDNGDVWRCLGGTTWIYSTNITGPRGFTIRPNDGEDGENGLTIPGLPGLGYYATSVQSVLLTLGNTGFIVFAQGNSNLAYTVGMRVRLTATASPSNWEEGAINAMAQSSISINVDLVNGSGTFSNWVLSVAGQVGNTGPAGPMPSAIFRGEDGEDAIMVPGIPGNPGATGGTGNTGAQGPIGPVVWGDPSNYDDEIPPVVPPDGADRLPIIRWYNSNNTVQQGLPPIVAYSRFDQVGVALAATTIYTAPTTGTYFIDLYSTVTAVGTGGTIDVKITWQDNSGAAAVTSQQYSMTATVQGPGNQPGIRRFVEAKAGTNIQLSAAFTGVTGNPNYSVIGVVSRVSL